MKKLTTITALFVAGSLAFSTTNNVDAEEADGLGSGGGPENAAEVDQEADQGTGGGPGEDQGSGGGPESEGPTSIADQSLEEEQDGINHAELQNLANNNPERLNEAPVYNGKYDITSQDAKNVYHFYSDGENWDWSVEALDSKDVSYEETIAEGPGQNFTDEELQNLVNEHPEKLDESPIYEGAYEFTNHDDKYAYHFYSDGEFWTWNKTPLSENSYETTIAQDNATEGLTNEKLHYIANVDPEKLNEQPVYKGEYDFTTEDENYVYHFYSNGESWTWDKTPLDK